FPLTNALDTTQNGPTDAYVLELSAAGDSLVYSTYLGGNKKDEGRAIAIDANGDAFVTGTTSSDNFPNVNAFQNSPGTSSDAFVTGSTASTDFPTVNPLQAELAGGSDAFLAKVASDGAAVTFSTFLGGSGNDSAAGVAVDANGGSYLTGRTISTDFPTKLPVEASLTGITDAFATRISPAGDRIAYSTYLGGSLNDFAAGVAVDADGNAFVVGTTGSSDYPT